MSNGLLFSSDSIPVDTFNFAEKPYRSLNKKERKMVFTLLRYLSRSTAKTTPFSSFNSIFALKQERDVFYPLKLDKSASKISINNLVYLVVIDALLAVFSVKKTFCVYINPTVRFVDETVNYFHNHNNNEAFFNIQNAPIVQFIVDFVLSKPIITYNDLLNEVVHVSGENIENVRLYIDQLIQQGIIIIQPPILIKDKDWVPKLSSYLRKLMSNNDSRDVATILTTILDSAIAAIPSLENTFDVKKREKVCCSVYNCFLSGMSQVKRVLGGVEISKTMEHLSPSMLFYEDTYTDDIAEVNFEKHKESISELGRLYGFIENRFGRKMVLKTTIKQQLETLYPDKKALLLSFYSDVYLKHGMYEKAMSGYGQNIYLELEPLMSFLKNNHPDELHIDDWLNCSETTSNEIPPFGLFVQVFNDTLVVNNLTSGIASNISRFIDFYASSSITEEIRTKIAEVYDNCIIPELTDASVHNTNTFVGLTDAVIDVSLKKSDIQRNINLNDLFIWVDDDGEVIIRNVEGEHVLPIDFSMESINRRSALMRFIDIFSDFNTEGLNLLLQAIDQFIVADRLQTESIIVFPRVYYSSIVLSRKRWLVRMEFLNSLFTSNEEESMQFVIFNNWRIENEIPDHIFIKHGMIYVNNKPQYINLKSPMYFQLLKNTVANMKTDFVELSEMLPAPEQLYQENNGYSYVIEYIINVVKSTN